jgi:hypothetical protein
VGNRGGGVAASGAMHGTGTMRVVVVVVLVACNAMTYCGVLWRSRLFIHDKWGFNLGELSVSTDSNTFNTDRVRSEEDTFMSHQPTRNQILYNISGLFELDKNSQELKYLQYEKTGYIRIQDSRSYQLLSLL